jgi:hypothetical protein
VKGEEYGVRYVGPLDGSKHFVSRGENQVSKLVFVIGIKLFNKIYSLFIKAHGKGKKSNRTIFIKTWDKRINKKVFPLIEGVKNKG